MGFRDPFDIVLGDVNRIATGWSLAIVSEGYTRAQLDNGEFDTDAAKVVKELERTKPFDDPALKRLIVVALVRVPSIRPGSDIKLLTPTPPTSPFQTAFGAMYGRETFNGKQIVRILSGNSAAVISTVRGIRELKSVANFLVIVNNTITDGGAADSGVGWFAKARASWPQVAIHELGHQAFALGDEYPYLNDENDPVRRYVGDEPVYPNLTINDNPATLKWSPLATLPAALIPGTVASVVCERPHPIRNANPPIAANDVGAFEGGGRADCDIFRPSPLCKMKDSKLPFCPVCENVVRATMGRYMVNGIKTLATFKVGAWTHAVPFEMPLRPGTLFYNAIAGNYALSDNFFFVNLERRPDGSPPLRLRQHQSGIGDLNPGWSSLAPFRLGGVLHVLGHDFGAGRVSIWRLAGNNDELVQTFFDTPGGTRSHTVALTLGGRPHVLAYNMFSGEAMLSRIDSNASVPVDVAAMSFGVGHTALVALDIDGEPFVLTYRALSGEVMVRRITASGFVMTFASRPFFWPTNVTHVAATPKAGLSYVVRHAAATGHTVIHHVDRKGAAVDFVTSVQPPPGPGALSFLGVGAQVLGLWRAHSNVHPDPDEDLYLYRALTQEMVQILL